MATPRADTRPNSARWPRSEFTVCVRCRTKRARVRNSAASACAASVFTATKRMVGRCAASTIARRVVRVALLPLDERLDVDWRNQPALMAERGHLPAPVVGPAARLHHHQARRQALEERQEPAPRQLLPEDRLAGGGRSVQLKNSL